MMNTILAMVFVAAQAAPSYTGKPLDDVLRDLQRRGLNVVFSSELVRADMSVAEEPKATTPRKILDEVLAPHALAVRGGPRDSFVVVRAKRSPQAAVKPAAPVPQVEETIYRTLSGVVVQADSKAPIEGATVSSGGQTATTGKDGRFSMRLKAVRSTISVSAEEFFPLTPTTDLTESDIENAEFALASQAGFASNVEVVTTAPSSSPSATVVPPQSVLKTAGSVDNVFHTLQTLPGVAAPQEFGSRITVRGGAPDQNLTVMDGVEVHDPFRLFGLTSAFNPEIIKRFELATSGFSAKYGDRLSSLLIVENRDGDPSRRFGTSGSMSMTDGNLVFEGKLPGKAPGSWLVTGRRTYYDLIAARFIKETFPQFDDVQTKVVWEPHPARKLTFFGLRSRQVVGVDDNRPEDGEHVQVNDDSRNDVAWMRFDTPIGAQGHSTTVAGYSRTLADFAFNSLSKTGFIQRSNAPYDLEQPIQDVAFSRRLAVSDVSLRQELAWSKGAHTIDVGGEVHSLRTSLKLQISGDRNFGEANAANTYGNLLAAPPGAGLPDAMDSRPNSTRAGAWVIDTWRPGSRAQLEAGVRLDRAGITRETSLSPRLTASFAVDDRLRARASFGLYTQSPGYEKMGQSDYALNLTAVTTGALRSERAALGAISLERTLGSGATLRVEAYYKRLSDLLLGRLETEPERLARLFNYNFPASLASSMPVDPIITTFPTNDGRGRAYGVDVLLSRMTAPVTAKWRGWVSYTWGKAELDAYGRTYPFDYDRRHAVSAVVSYRKSPKWEFASTTRWATGFPRTAPVGLRAAGEERTLAGRTLIEPKRDSFGLVYEVDFGGVSNLNNARLTNYARADLRATWKPRGVMGRWDFYLEVINVLNRKNSATFEATVRYDPKSTRPQLVDKPGDRIPIIPTIGVRWRF
jgi:hypothetical protein